MTRGVGVVVPLRDEADNVGPLVAELAATLGEGDWQVALVDDGSTDGTGEAVEAAAALHPGRVVPVRLGAALGKQAALEAGARALPHPWIVTMDGDLQDDPADIARLLAARDAAGADVVIGAREQRAEGWAKRAPSRVLNALVRRRFGLDLHDVNAPLRLVRREHLVDGARRHQEFRFLPVVWAQAGLGVVEVPVRQRPRRHGRSKYRRPWRFVEALFVLSTLPAGARRGGRWGRAGRVAVTALLLALVLAAVDLDEAGAALRSTPWPVVAGLGVAHLAVLAVRSHRWRFILAGWGHRWTARGAYVAYLVGTLLGAVTPLRLGAFGRAAWVVRDTGAPTTTALASVLTDRLLDLAVLLALAPGGLLVAFGAGPGARYGAVAAAAVAVAGAVACLRVDPVRGVRLGRPAVLGPGVLTVPLALTGGAYVVFFSLAWGLARAQGVDVGAVDLACVLAGTNLLSLLPATLSGVGTREAALYLLLPPLGVPGELALAYAVAYFLAFYVVPAGGGAVALLVDGRISGRGARP